MADLINTGSFRMICNDHELVGLSINGRWTFDCPDFEDIERAHENATDSAACIAAFVRRASVVTVEEC
jgi:hypothetical protein